MPLERGLSGTWWPVRKRWQSILILALYLTYTNIMLQHARCGALQLSRALTCMSFWYSSLLCFNGKWLHASPHQSKVWYLFERLQCTLARYSEIPAPKFDTYLNLVWNARWICVCLRNLACVPFWCVFWVAPRFSQCELCFHFKNALANAETMEERLGTLVRYRKHLADQYQDRSICWGLQELCLDEMSNLLVLQTDGMDQGKFRLPRDPKLRASAAVCLAGTCWFLCHGVMPFWHIKLASIAWGPLKSVPN